VLDTPQTATPSLATLFALRDHFRFDASSKSADLRGTAFQAMKRLAIPVVVSLKTSVRPLFEEP
jgi:hypothetical protein